MRLAAGFAACLAEGFFIALRAFPPDLPADFADIPERFFALVLERFVAGAFFAPARFFFVAMVVLR